jgi:hypothetical protein
MDRVLPLHLRAARLPLQDLPGPCGKLPHRHDAAEAAPCTAAAAQPVEQVPMPPVAQMTASDEQRLDLEHYLAKTYCKTASLMANSSRAVAVLAGASPEVRPGIAII